MIDQTDSDEEKSDLLGYEEASAMLGVPRGTVYAWVHSKTIPHVRLGPRLVRFVRGQLVEWLNEHHVTVVSRRAVRGGAR